jgi:protease-4
MDKLGIKANVYRVGTYKAAVEPFTRSDMSPEAREALQAVADHLWEGWQQNVRQARPKAQIAAYVADPGGRAAAAGGDMAKTAQTLGLIDRIGDRSAFGRRLAEIVGTEDDSVPDSFRTIKFDPWVAANPASDEDGEIGVLTVAGDIVDGEAGSGTAGAETIVQNLEEGLKNGHLKALVVRVDSGGGSALASERIRQAVATAKAKGLPVVVSMGNVAASGGYWVSTVGDKIYAEPSTITGSIGVFGLLPSFEGTLAKLGLGADGIKTTPLSGEPDLLRGPSPEAGRLLQMGVENVYQRFLGLVSGARKLPVARVDQIAQGRIWDGGTAHQLGLVDAFGGLEDAIAEAARRAKLDPNDVDVAWLEKKPGFADEMLMALASDDDSQTNARDAFGRIGARPGIALMQAVAEAEHVLAGPSIQVRCLECPPSASARPPAREIGFTAWLRGLLAS